MKCRDFDSALADYITGRLSAEQACAVMEHARVCNACERLRRYEVNIANAMAELKMQKVDANLWPAVSRAVASAQRVRRAPLVRTRWVFASGVSACAVAAGLFLVSITHRPPASPTATLTDVRPVVQLASELNRLPDPDLEGDFRNTEAREALFSVGR